MTAASLTRSDRIQGCLLGGALGDALGSHFEGLPASQQLDLPRHLSITDDTQLTLATCEAILERKCVTPESIATNFLRWYRSRRITGIGSATLKALTELDAGGHWAMVGATGERAAGNGAAMRIAPLAFVLDPAQESNRTTIRDVCRITHRNDEAYVGALAMVYSLHHTCEGNVLHHGWLQALARMLPDSNMRDRLLYAHDTQMTLATFASTYGTSGYVADSVPLAILAATQSTDFLTTITSLLQCGGDTDTIASLFGQLYGSLHGPEALPSDLLLRIDDFQLINDVANDFAIAACKR